MMYNQGRSHLNSDSMSSETSNATSRGTTFTGSFSDIKSNTTPEYQPITSGLDQLNIHSIEDDHSSAFSSTAPSVSTVINMKLDMNTIKDNRSNEMIAHKQQKPWVNPYWGPNWKPNTTATQSEANTINKNTNIQYSSAPTGIHQLIPGSILINDQGEIDDLLWSQNTYIQTILSNNPLNPTDQYIVYDNPGSGGYLAPTHIQRRIVTSSPGVSANPESHFGYRRSSSSSNADTRSRPAFNRQQTFPERTDNNIQPWVNPYWGPQPNQTNSQFTQNNNRIGNQQSVPLNNSTKNTWVNPYWGPKPNQTNSQFTQNNNRIGNQQSVPLNNSTKSTWVNPYWGPKPSEKSTPSTGIQKPQISTIPKQDNWQFQNPYLKDKNAFDQNNNVNTLDIPLPCEFPIMSVPSFYKRIYPPYESLSTPMSTVNMKHNEIFSQHINNDEDMPFTIDNQGIVHYRPEPSSPSILNKTANIPPSSTMSQYPVLPPTTHTNVLSSKTANTATVPQITNSVSPSYPKNMTSAPLMNLSNDTPSSFDYYSSLTSSSAAVLTEADLNSIQHALHLLETSPNVISVIEPSQQVPSTNISHANQPSSSLASLFTVNKQQQSQPLPPPPSSSSFSANTQHNTPLQAYISNSAQPPLFSTPSYPSNPNNTLSRLATKGSIFLI
ncbi:unnamed protein product [Rotaria sp. Silwood2]|nr:unnamed protein product [Rotaria sp. Silwood2]CAF3887961.1 unnamed protein product [Rotaria sp. Silwood2]CAF4137695.1 unnamed protein product [Rotaria sp. Silwood2]